MLGTHLAFETSLKVEDCMIGLYFPGHVVGIWVPALGEMLNVKIMGSSTIFDGDKGESDIEQNPHHIFLSGDASIQDLYTGTLAGCQAFLDRLRTAKSIRVTTMPSALR